MSNADILDPSLLEFRGPSSEEVRAHFWAFAKCELESVPELNDFCAQFNGKERYIRRFAMLLEQVCAGAEPAHLLTQADLSIYEAWLLTYSGQVERMLAYPAAYGYGQSSFTGEFRVPSVYSPCPVLNPANESDGKRLLDYLTPLRERISKAWAQRGQIKNKTLHNAKKLSTLGAASLRFAHGTLKFIRNVPTICIGAAKYAVRILSLGAILCLFPIHIVYLLVNRLGRLISRLGRAVVRPLR